MANERYAKLNILMLSSIIAIGFKLIPSQAKQDIIKDMWEHDLERSFCLIYNDGTIAFELKGNLYDLGHQWDPASLSFDEIIKISGGEHE